MRLAHAQLSVSRVRRLALLALAVGLVACTPLPPRVGEVQQAPSPNFDARRPNLVVIHHTSGSSMGQAQRTLSTPERKVSAHYLIGRDGAVVQLVDESARAWHAGQSWWGGVTDVNSLSIGIELDNNGFEAFPDAQIDALLRLLGDIRQRQRIPAANFVGHADVAPLRKDDPSELFPWRVLAEHGFGLWCEPPSEVAGNGANALPQAGDLGLLLTALGYDPRAPEASRKAFRLHYMRGGEWSDADELAVARCLLDKKSRWPGEAAAP